jgi:alkanesulfonate monooxygenase SsuD/methylene tetrahydromethanopterin reductase-like flavin-dependent oxidoreductase (luciferase family)
MKFSNFLFPASHSPAHDFEVIQDALQEAELSDALGFDTVWLAEHHFDGGCAYVDPMTFATAIAARTKQIRVGFAVAQMALYHPIRLAEQIAVIDNVSQGRLTVGLGRGTAYNFYEYRGYGIDPTEAHERLIEAEAILAKVWTAQDYRHEGKFWQIELPELRPQVYQKPHPPVIRACSGLESTLEMAREGRPFLMNVQNNEVTRQRMDAYRQAMAEAGYDDDAIADTVRRCWAWRNVFVAETDGEAADIGISAFQAMRQHLGDARQRLNRLDELAAQAAARPGHAMHAVDTGLVYGSSETVRDKLAPVYESGVGGLILHFRLGSLPWEATARSLRLFAEQVAPAFAADDASAGHVHHPTTHPVTEVDGRRERRLP